MTKLDNCAGKQKKTDKRQGCEVELTRGRRKKKKEKTSKTESCSGGKVTNNNIKLVFLGVPILCQHCHYQFISCWEV